MPKPEDYPNYLIVEGLFIYAVLMALYGILGLSCIVIICLSLSISIKTRKASTEDELFETRMSSAYKTTIEKQIYSKAINN